MDIKPPLLDSIAELRKTSYRHVQEAAKKGMLIRLIIVAAELIAFATFSSATILFDAIATILDIIISISLLFFIKIASRPPDKEHPFGHGRYEPIAGLQLSLFLIVVGVCLAFQQVSTIQDLKAHTHAPIEAHIWLIPLGAMLLLELGYRLLSEIGKRENSSALQSEALHFRLDALTSLLATVALAIGSMRPDWRHFLDHLGALAISLLMIGSGAFAARRNAQQLMDRVPDEKYFNLVREAALRVRGVEATEKLLIQLYGPDAHISIDVEVDPELPVIKAHLLTQQVRLEIQKSFPAARDVIVHLEPY